MYSMRAVRAPRSAQALGAKGWQALWPVHQAGPTHTHPPSASLSKPNLPRTHMYQLYHPDGGYGGGSPSSARLGRRGPLQATPLLSTHPAATAPCRCSSTRQRPQPVPWRTPPGTTHVCDPKTVKGARISAPRIQVRSPCDPWEGRYAPCWTRADPAMLP
jgi:hypothetical protein